MVNVAVYGSLRKGMGNHSILSGSKCLGTTTTVEPYAMYSLGGFPMVSLEGVRMSPIVVEVYECDERTLSRLNMLEGYRGKGADNFYDCSEIQTGEGPALIYHIEDRVGHDPVPDGDWVSYCKQRQSRY